MQIPHYQLTLDVNATVNNQRIIAKQHDDQSRYIDIMLVADNRPILLSSERVTLTAADRKTHETIALTDCTITDGIIVAELTANILSTATTLDCEITVYGTTGGIITSARFICIVDAKISTDVVERESDFSALQSALSDAAKTADRINEIAARVQPISLGGTGKTTAQEAAQAMRTAFLATAELILENSDLDTFLIAGTYECTDAVAKTLINCPVTTGFKLYVISQDNGVRHIQILYAAQKNEIWHRGSTGENVYSEWRYAIDNTNISKNAIPTFYGADIGKLRSDNTTHNAAEMMWGTDYNDLTETGFYIIRGNADFPTVNAPDGLNTNNVFYVLHFYYSTSFQTQVAISVRSERTIYTRMKSADAWTEWTKTANTDDLPAEIETGTWTPESIEGTITARENSSKYAYDGKCVTIASWIDIGDDVTAKSLTISGLPFRSSVAAAMSVNVIGDSTAWRGLVNGNSNTVAIANGQPLAGKSVLITATYFA